MDISKREFAAGSTKIVLSQADLAKAIEFWLNEKILKLPCNVVQMSESRVNEYSTFEINYKSKMLKMPTRAVVYIVSGKKHIEQAVRSSGNLKSNCDVVLASPDIDNIPYDKPLQIDRRVDLSEIQHNYWLLDRVKYFNYIINNLTYNQFLILDSDTYACNDIAPFFDILDHVDIAGTHSIAQQTLWRDDIPQSFPEVHCGALVFNRNERVKMLFERWYEIYASRPSYFGNDQPALRQALWEDKDIRLGILPQEFCFRFRWGGLLSRQVILLHGKEHKTSYEKIAKEVNAETGIRVYHRRELT